MTRRRTASPKEAQTLDSRIAAFDRKIIEAYERGDLECVALLLRARNLVVRAAGGSEQSESRLESLACQLHETDAEKNRREVDAPGELQEIHAEIRRRRLGGKDVPAELEAKGFLLGLRVGELAAEPEENNSANSHELRRRLVDEAMKIRDSDGWGTWNDLPPLPAWQRARSAKHLGVAPGDERLVVLDSCARLAAALDLSPSKAGGIEDRQVRRILQRVSNSLENAREADRAKRRFAERGLPGLLRDRFEMYVERVHEDFDGESPLDDGALWALRQRARNRPGSGFVEAVDGLLAVTAAFKTQGKSGPHGSLIECEIAHRAGLLWWVCRGRCPADDMPYLREGKRRRPGGPFLGFLREYFAAIGLTGPSEGLAKNELRPHFRKLRDDVGRNGSGSTPIDHLFPDSARAALRKWAERIEERWPRTRSLPAEARKHVIILLAELGIPQN